MKCFLLLPYSGPMLVLTKYDSLMQPEILEKLGAYGKFIGFEVPMEVIRTQYGAHFEHVLKDPNENQELIVLDPESQRIYTNIDFHLLSNPVYYEPKQERKVNPIPVGPASGVGSVNE